MKIFLGVLFVLLIFVGILYIVFDMPTMTFRPFGNLVVMSVVFLVIIGVVGLSRIVE